MVPDGWERQPIKYICESIIDCVNKTAKTVDYATPYKMIRTTNVRHGRVDTDNVRYVTEDVYKEWIRRGTPKDGDLIFTREAPVGEVGILKDSKGIFLGQRTMMYRAHPDKSDNYFLHYSLQNSYCQKQIENFSNGGTVAHMRVPDCGMIIINTPPLPEQKKIAQILSTWDKAISTTEALIENSQQQKKALMQQLLTGKKRFPGFEGEWKEVRLSKLTEVITKGTTPSTNGFDFKSSGITFVKVESILSNGLFNKSKFAFINNECHQSFKRSQLKNNDVLFSIAGALGRTVIVNESILPANTNQALAIVRLNFNEVETKYVYYQLNSSSISKAIKTQTAQAAQPNLSLKDVGSFKIKLPCLKEQQKIASVLTNADNEIELLEKQLADLKQEKKALMQQLLTGKRRVNTIKAV